MWLVYLIPTGLTTGFIAHFVTQLHQVKVAPQNIKEKSINIVHEIALVSSKQFLFFL